MFSFSKGLNRFIYFIDAINGRNQRLINVKKPFAFFENSQIRLYGVIHSNVNKTNFLITSYQCRLPILRNKSKSKRMSYNKRYEYESSDDDSDDDDDDNMKFQNDSNYVGQGEEIITRSLKSMRVDLILKSTLNISRKKVEENFYQNKIRINGKVLRKKSQNAKIGDQIDIIHGIENFKLNTLKVGRVVIVEAEADPDNDRVILKVLKSKSLIIDNSSYQDEWKEPIKEGF